jgi:hypothetical protein
VPERHGLTGVVENATRHRVEVAGRADLRAFIVKPKIDTEFPSTARPTTARPMPSKRARTRPDPITILLAENIQPRPRRGGWHGGPTPHGALRGVRAEQAAWVPAPGRKSVWALALHIAYWKYAVRRRLEGRAARPDERFPRSPANWPVIPNPADDRAWAADIALLKREHERLVAVVRAIPPERYGERVPGGKRWTFGELIVGIAQHDAYHAGQIQMLKRLWTAMR